MPRLMWDKDGTVACEKHVPDPGDPAFVAGRWLEVRANLLRTLACDLCAGATAPSRRKAPPRRLRLVTPSPAPPAGALSCHFCKKPADRMLVEDPEQLPAEFPPDPVSAQPGCADCDDGTWSRVYPIEADTKEGARAAAIARRLQEAAEARPVAAPLGEAELAA